MTLTSTRTPALGCWVDARTGIGAAVFKNPMTTAAAIDHLVHHSTILEFAVPSLRSDKARNEPPDKAVVVTKYYQGGAMAVVERRDTGARLSLDDPLQHRWFCGHSLPGFMEEFIVLAGRQVVHVRQDMCQWNGAEHCELDVEWR